MTKQRFNNILKNDYTGFKQDNTNHDNMATMPLKNVQESIKFYQQMALIQWDLVKSCLTNRSKKWGEQGAGEWEPSVNDSVGAEPYAGYPVCL